MTTTPKTDVDGTDLKPDEKYSSFLVNTKRNDDEEAIADNLLLITPNLTHKILEIQRCPKCGKECTNYSAIFKDGNTTEICPKCEIKETVEAYQKFAGRK